MGCVSKVLNNPLTTIATDVGLSLIPGGAPFIPLANAAERTAGGVAKGESFGKAVGQGAISGVEALGAQELAGAVGIGEGNSAFNSALGITGDNPAGTGLPDLGAMFGGGSSGSGATNAAGATVDPTTGATTAPPSTPTSTSPVSGGGFIGSNAVIDAGNSQINAQIGDLGNVGSDLGATSAPTNLGSVASNAIGASNSLSLPAGASDLGSNVISGGASGTGIGSQAMDALTQPGAPSSATLAANNQTFNSLQSSGLPGTAAPAASPAATAAAGPAASSGGLLNTIENTAIKSALPLGALAYDAIKGPSALPSGSAALQPGGAATAPLLGLETSAANEASTGQLTPTQMASIQQGVQQQQNQLIQQLASEGATDPTHDSRYIEGMKQIQQWALAQQQAYITQAVNTAVSAGGAASANIGAVANQQIQQDKDFQDSLASAFGALGGGGVNINTARAA